MKTLNIGSIKLPLDSITQTFAILAKRRVGKTYTASVIAEEFVKNNLPFVALDPTGAWWGLSSGKNGKSAGFPVYIIGGDRGIPLEPTAGKVIADQVAENPSFYVIDISKFESNAAQDRFATDFAERLYRIKSSHKEPLHLFIDEADAFIPQRPMPGQQKMLGAYESLVRRGGIKGIGVTMITQRAAVINKNVLSQAECLITLQTTSPHDQDAIEDWVKRNGTDENRKILMTSLASLQQGEAWFYSPAWLEVFKKVKVRERETYNSSATPKVGEKRIINPVIAKVNLDKLSQQIKSTIEKVKQNDPLELKKKIRELELELKKKPAEKNVQNNLFKQENFKLKKDVQTLQHQIKKISIDQQKIFAGIQKAITSITNLINYEIPIVEIKESDLQQNKNIGAEKIIHKHITVPAMGPRERIGGQAEFSDNRTTLGRCPLMILKFLSLRSGLSFNKKQIAAMIGYSPRSGSFNNAISQLVVKNLIIRIDGNLQLNETKIDEAIELLGEEYNSPNQSSIEDWLHKLGKCPKIIYQQLLENPYKEFNKNELGELTGYSSVSGNFASAVSKLCTLGLAERANGNIRLNQEII